MIKVTRLEIQNKTLSKEEILAQGTTKVLPHKTLLQHQRKFGHLEKYCRAKKARNNTQGVQQEYVSEEDQVEDENLFMALDTKDNPRVKLGDGRYARAKGKGIIAINMKKATLDMVNDSYYLKLDAANANAFSVTEDASMKWHEKFGHFNYIILQHKFTTKLVRDMPPISEVDSKCEGCELGKIHSKALVFSIFKSFKKLVEVQSGNNLHILRTDNGEEYTSNEFEYFLLQQGVIHQVTVPYSPQQNGVFERKNRMVIEMARSRHKRLKLDAKARKGIFFGYAKESKGYRIYDLTDSKIAISRDMNFDERAYWDSNVVELKRHEHTFSNQTHHDEVDIPKFDIKGTTDTDVLKTRLLVDVYESCNSIIEPESYMDASKHSELIDAMKVVTDMSKIDKIKGKTDKPSMRLERA
uniref:Integrase catalytic domain-containing protein n=1 Tax=Tanacetum cinerariifolium TaxID=118510 RepID=A0A699HGF3_TANCI|nr:hypothetical protein [Tanacetum cinerariifolium]